MSEATSEQWQIMTKMVLHQLDQWELTSEQIIVLLGMDEETKARQLGAYRAGTKLLSNTPETRERVNHIVGIADALRTTFPFSEPMRLMWLCKPHRRFQRRTPLEVMIQDGLDGLLRVRIEVDCSYGYAIDEALRRHSHSTS